MPRIIFLNRFFYPDHSATSQILSDLAFHLADTGGDIHVIASQQRYDDANARLPEYEVIRGVGVRRVPTTRFGRAQLIGRAFDYLSYYRAVGEAVAGIARPGDILVAKTDPPLLSVVAARAAKRSGARLVNWLQDLYPEAAIALGVPLMKGPAANILARLRDKSLHAATTNVVLGDAMAGRLVALGIPPDKISIIPNWTDDESIVPMPVAGNPLRREWHLEGKFVVGYSGNFGRAHDFDAMLAAAQRLRDHERIAFVFIGGGRQRDTLVRYVRDKGLERTVRVLPYQDRAALPSSLAVADVHWLSLRPELEGVIFPSKFYGIAAAGRPIIALTDPGGEIAGLLGRYCCGFAVGLTDVDCLTALLTTLAGDPARCDELGRRSRAMLNAAFTRRHAFSLWRTVLNLD
ncbi:MAG: glycosyltransferase family 4 protein [Pseudolabrys sp.]|nr:glycosyltransferase family 4 protein [Pseudolabrys sp.]MDP2296951.1 glycosyltransferase family 4 protein [Pseudolabrys sp.]